MLAKVLVVILLWQLVENSDGAAVKLYNQSLSKNLNISSNNVMVAPNAFVILLNLTNSNKWHKIASLLLNSSNNNNISSVKKNAIIPNSMILLQFASKSPYSKGKFNLKVAGNFSVNELEDTQQLPATSNVTEIIKNYHKSNLNETNAVNQNRNAMMAVKSCENLDACEHNRLVEKPINTTFKVDVEIPNAKNKANDSLNEYLKAYNTTAEEYNSIYSEDMDRLMPIIKRLSNNTKISSEKMQNLLKKEPKLKKFINKATQYSFINPDNHVIESQILAAVQNIVKKNDMLSKLYLNSILNVK